MLSAQVARPETNMYRYPNLVVKNLTNKCLHYYNLPKKKSIEPKYFTLFKVFFLTSENFGKKVHTH
jgi:hypothetical protein